MSRTVSLVSRSGSAFEISKTDLKGGPLDVELEEGGKAAKAQKVVFRLKHEQVKGTKVRQTVVLHTTSPDDPTVEIPIFALLRK